MLFPAQPAARLLALATLLSACDDARGRQWQQVPLIPIPAPPQPAPRPPHRCETCNGTGSITQSYESTLPAEISRCDVESTGFLGLGSERAVNIGVINNGDEAGNFTFRVIGNYPGGGTVTHGEVAAVHLLPHAMGYRQIRIVPQDGLINVTCRVISPTVIQHRQALCPACNGRGLLP